MNERLLTIDEVLQVVPVSRVTLYKLWNEGKGPKTVRVGKRRFVRPAELTEWVKSLEGDGEEANN